MAEVTWAVADASPEGDPERLVGDHLRNIALLRAVKKLGKDGSGTAVFMLTRTPSGLKLAGIDLFEVR